MFDLATRRAYVIGTEFDKRMYNIYEGIQTHSRPPYLEDLFVQESSMQAAILLEQNKQSYNEKEWNELVEAVWDDDSIAKFEVLERFKLDNASAVIDEIVHYLFFYRLPFLTRDEPLQPISQARLINPPVKAIW